MTRRHRALAAAWVAAGLLPLHALAPDAALRREALTLVALPIGYGHLLGGLLFSGRGRVDLLGAALVASGLSTLLCVYLALIAGPSAAIVLSSMLVVSSWHILENDLALARAYRSGLRVAPIPRGVHPHLLAAAGTALLGAMALASPAGAAALAGLGLRSLPFVGPCLEDLAAGVLLYHAASWLLFVRERARSLPVPAARRLRRSLWLLHAAPVAVNAAAYLWLPALHVWVASPAVYLFWSVAHAFQTGWRRGLEPAK